MTSAAGKKTSPEHEKPHGNWLLLGSTGLSVLAETGGFEPPVEFNPDPSLAVKSIRPLWHVSIAGGAGSSTWPSNTAPLILAANKALVKRR